MCAQLAKPEGAGIPVAELLPPGPSCTHRRPPSATVTPPRRSTRDSHPPSGAPAACDGISRFLPRNRVLWDRSCSVARPAPPPDSPDATKRASLTPRTSRSAPLGGTMTPASHPRQPGPHGPVSHKPRFHGRNPIIRSHDLPFRRGRRSSTPRGGGASRPRLPPRPHRALPAGRTNHGFRALDPPASRTHIPSECLKSGGGFKAPKRGCRHAPTASSGKTICPINPSQPVAGQPKKEAGPQARPICAKPEGSPWRICWPGTSPDTRPVRRAPQRDDPTSP